MANSIHSAARIVQVTEKVRVVASATGYTAEEIVLGRVYGFTLTDVAASLGISLTDNEHRQVFEKFA